MSELRDTLEESGEKYLDKYQKAVINGK